MPRLDQSQLRITMRKYKTLSDIQIDYDSLIRDMVDALAYLEVNDILHNDIKPDNILYDPVNDRYLLIDFGIATKFNICHSDRSGTELTLAPELLEGPFTIPAPQDVDFTTTRPRNDIFSLGATLFMLLTGYPWFGRRANNTMDDTIIYRTAEGRVGMITTALKRDYLDDLGSSPYRAVISRMMSFHPQDRPSALQLVRELYFDQVDQAYTMVKLPTLQLPSDWSVDQIKSIQNEIPVMRSWSYSGRDKQFHQLLDSNSYKLAMTYFSLKPPKTSMIPVYLFVALKLSEMICHSSQEVEWSSFLEYFRLWQEGWSDPMSFYNQFPADWDAIVVDVTAVDYDINPIGIDMSSSLNFRILFDYWYLKCFSRSQMVKQ